MSELAAYSALASVFTSKYEDSDSDWVGNSGPGSNPFYTLPYRGFLESFIRLNHIGSVVDIGCGDWQFSRYLDLDGVDYLGFDLVESVIGRNRARFGAPNVRFEVMPTDHAEIPPAHLLVMKDVLQHLPTADILKFYEDLFPRFNFCLITNSFRKMDVPVNTEIAPGAFRCLDLRAAPFHFRGAYVLQFATGVWEEIRTLLYTP